MASELENDVRATMSDVMSYVQPRVTSIESYVSELDRLKQQLLMTSSSDQPKLMGEFDRNVHVMVITVNECLRQWDATLKNLQRINKQLAELKMDGISFGIELSLVTPIVMLWIINKYYGIMGMGLAGVGLVSYVHRRRSIQEASAQLQLVIKTKFNDIDQSKSLLHNYISEVKVQQLHNNSIQVRAVPTYD